MGRPKHVVDLAGGASAVPNVASAPPISVINQELRDALRNVLSETEAAVQGLSNESRFFKNGIELLYIKIEAGINANLKISAELKLAGPKDPRDGSPQGDASDFASVDVR